MTPSELRLRGERASREGCQEERTGPEEQDAEARRWEGPGLPGPGEPGQRSQGMRRAGPGGWQGPDDRRALLNVNLNAAGHPCRSQRGPRWDLGTLYKGSFGCCVVGGQEEDQE